MNKISALEQLFLKEFFRVSNFLKTINNYQILFSRKFDHIEENTANYSIKILKAKQFSARNTKRAGFVPN